MRKYSILLVGAAIIALLSMPLTAQGRGNGRAFGNGHSNGNGHGNGNGNGNGHGNGGRGGNNAGGMPLPEPMTISLMALGAAGVGLASRKKRKTQGN